MKENEAERKELLHAVLDLGEMMLTSGAEVKRVEDTITRMGIASGAVKMNVFVITSSIVVTMEDPEEKEYTETRRVLVSGANDFQRLEEMNQLSRDFCRKPCSSRELQDKIMKIASEPKKHSWSYAGSFLGAGGFAVFFGGSMLDGLIAGVMGLFVQSLSDHLEPHCPNAVTFNLLASFLTGLCVSILSRINPVLNADLIMIGDIMLLIPGIPMTNSIRDVLVGDTISGTLRLTESLVRAAAIAAGFMLAIMAAGR